MDDLKEKIERFQQKIAAEAATAKVPDAYRCLVCKDGGMEAVITDGIEKMRRCTQCDYWARKRGLTPGVPDDETDSTLDNYRATRDNANAIEQARLFIDGTHPNLFIYGGVGVGKTRLACSIVNTIWRGADPPSTLFCRVPELLMRFQPGGDGDEEDGIGGWFDRVTKVQLLVLDDIGAQQGTDFARRQLQSIYDKRLDLAGRTIFTSNLSLDDLAAFLNDDRLPSRIVGSAKIVRMDGKDHRKDNAKHGKLVGMGKERRTGAERRRGDPRLPTGDRD